MEPRLHPRAVKDGCNRCCARRHEHCGWVAGSKDARTQCRTCQAGQVVHCLFRGRITLNDWITLFFSSWGKEVTWWAASLSASPKTICTSSNQTKHWSNRNCRVSPQACTPWWKLQDVQWAHMSKDALPCIKMGHMQQDILTSAHIPLTQASICSNFAISHSPHMHHEAMTQHNECQDECKKDYFAYPALGHFLMFLGHHWIKILLTKKVREPGRELMWGKGCNNASVRKSKSVWVKFCPWHLFH